MEYLKRLQTECSPVSNEHPVSSLTHSKQFIIFFYWNIKIDLNAKLGIYVLTVTCIRIVVSNDEMTANFSSRFYSLKVAFFCSESNKQSKREMVFHA